MLSIWIFCMFTHSIYRMERLGVTEWGIRLEKKVVNMMWIKEALFSVGVCFITPNYLIARIKGSNTIPNIHHTIKLYKNENF